MFNVSRHKTIQTLLLITTFGAADSFADDSKRTITLQEDVAKAQVIKLNLPVGKVVISGTTGNTIKAEVTGICKEETPENCTPLFDQLAWAKKLEATAEFSLNPSSVMTYDNVDIQININLPKDKKLEVYQGAGELSLVGTNACLIAELKAGELKIEANERELASANLASTVGDVSLINTKGQVSQGARAKLVGSELAWKGFGKCQLKANVTAGKVTMKLK
jgi:hypothetical protein